MVQAYGDEHAAHTSEGTKMRSDHLAGESVDASDGAVETSEATKIRAAGLGVEDTGRGEVDDTDEASKIVSDGLRTTPESAHSGTTEGDKMESDGLR